MVQGASRPSCLALLFREVGVVEPEVHLRLVRYPVAIATTVHEDIGHVNAEKGEYCSLDSKLRNVSDLQTSRGVQLCEDLTI